jgi:hypothetical protein
VQDCSACHEPCIALGTMSVCGHKVCGVCTTRSACHGSATLSGHFCCPVCPVADGACTDHGPQGCTFYRTLSSTEELSPEPNAVLEQEAEVDGAASCTRTAALAWAGDVLADVADPPPGLRVVGLRQPGGEWVTFAATVTAPPDLVVAVALALSTVIHSPIGSPDAPIGTRMSDLERLALTSCTELIYQFNWALLFGELMPTVETEPHAMDPEWEPAGRNADAVPT